MIDDELWQGDPVRRLLEYSVVLKRPVVFRHLGGAWQVVVGEKIEPGALVYQAKDLDRACRGMCEFIMEGNGVDP